MILRLPPHTILIIDDNANDVEIARLTLAQIDRELRVESALRRWLKG